MDTIGHDPKNYTGEEIRRALVTLGDMLNEPTVDFLARTYTCQELAEALAVRLTRDQREQRRANEALNRVMREDKSFGAIFNSHFGALFDQRNHSI